MSSRFVRWSLAFWRGGDEVEEALHELSRVVEIRRDGQEIKISGKVQTGFLIGDDPVTIAVCLMMSIIGPLWPFACSRVLDEVNREWKKNMKKTHSPKKSKTSQPPLWE